MPDESTSPIMPPVVPVDGGTQGSVMTDDNVQSVASTVPVSPFEPVGSPVMNDVVVAPVVGGAAEEKPQKVATPSNETQVEVIQKINEAHNVLIALSSDPSVDELAAAIGLSIFLDKMGKRATAIYSGSTPNALEFLKPEETFETSADTLQDFVIALNKEKADHLRYKLDGDYVKIYITPYRHRLAEEDLEYSYGDYNVDLVLALDVANGIDLDSALREHGRIMHDAVIINVTTGNPGKFGEIEWSDKSASSVSEMVARLLYSMSGKVKIEKEEATAFLTGIVAATNRFSSAGTTPETMRMSSRLMESGANQQLISRNITADVDNEMLMIGGIGGEKQDLDPTKLNIGHGNEEGVDETKVVDDTITEKESTLLEDLKAAEASLAQAGAEAVAEVKQGPVKLDEMRDDDLAGNDAVGRGDVGADVSEASVPEISLPEAVTQSTSVPEMVAPASEDVIQGTSAPEMAAFEPGVAMEKPEKVIAPLGDFETNSPDDDADKYGKMLEDALADAGAGDDSAVMNASIVSSADEDPAVASVQTELPSANGDISMPVMPLGVGGNPAAMNAPTVASAPEINGVPSINYMPMPGEEILPPPPTPPIDLGASVVDSTSAPAVSAQAEVNSPAQLGVAQPAPTPVQPAPIQSAPVAEDNLGAFKIPGM